MCSKSLVKYLIKADQPTQPSTMPDMTDLKNKTATFPSLNKLGKEGQILNKLLNNPLYLLKVKA